jgi:antirestriction protein
MTKLSTEAKKYKTADEFMMADIQNKNKFMSPSDSFKRLSELDSQELNRAIGTKDWENIPNEVTLYR